MEEVSRFEVDQEFGPAEEEEEVSFDEEDTASQVSVGLFLPPGYEHRLWLLVLPILIVSALAWNVKWRNSSRQHVSAKATGRHRPGGLRFHKPVRERR